MTSRCACRQSTDWNPTNPKGIEVKKRIIIAAALAATICVGVAGYAVATAGPSEAEQRAQDRYERAVKDYRVDVREWKQDVAEWNDDTAAYDECETALGQAVDEGVEFNGLMDAGLSLDEFGDEHAELTAALAIAPALSSDCAGIQDSLYTASEAWSKAGEAWEDCIDDYYCDMDSLDKLSSEFQTQLGAADVAAYEAKTELEGMVPGEKPERPERPRKPVQG